MSRGLHFSEDDYNRLRGRARSALDCSAPSVAEGVGRGDAAPPKPSKYHNEPVTLGAMRFDSRKEVRRYYELTILERAGKIANLRRQVRIEVIPACNGQRSIVYVADFIYDQDGEEIWEDVKGIRSAVYLIKKKLVMWRYGKRIRET